MISKKYSNIDIKIVDESLKFEKVKLVKPNIKFNRCDIRYGSGFELLEIKYDDKTIYISYFIEGCSCKLGLYMVEIPSYVFNAIIDFIVRYKKVSDFQVTQSLNFVKGLNPAVHWLLHLPDTWEEYFNSFSSKSRYNKRYYKRKLEENYECKWEHLSENEIDENIIKKFFELKKQKKVIYYSADEKEFLGNFYKVTDAYILYIDNEIKSIVLYSIIDERVAYCENLAYDLDFSKENIGNLLYYYSLQDLIKRGIKTVYLGGGKYDYKKNSKAIKSNTYNGRFYRLKWWQRIFYFYIENIPVKKLTLIIFGIIIHYKFKKKCA